VYTAHVQTCAGLLAYDEPLLYRPAGIALVIGLLLGLVLLLSLFLLCYAKASRRRHQFADRKHTLRTSLRTATMPHANSDEHKLRVSVSRVSLNHAYFAGPSQQTGIVCIWIAKHCNDGYEHIRQQ
jgi:hypothetical protein